MRLCGAGKGWNEMRIERILIHHLAESPILTDEETVWTIYPLRPAYPGGSSVPSRKTAR